MRETGLADVEFGLVFGDFKDEFGNFNGVFSVFNGAFADFNHEVGVFKHVGVPFYDSIATYDSGLMYDDPSSPQPTRNGFFQNPSGVACL